MTKLLTGALSVVGLALLIAYLVTTWHVDNTFASVGVTDEYIATSTAANGYLGAFTTGRLLRSGYGTLGSVVITGANSGVVSFYNATTTDINKRLGNTSTSSIHLATIPASAAAGTYTFDVIYTDGLFVDRNPQDLGGGAFPTSTITYR